MANFRVRAFAAGLAAEAIRSAVPTKDGLLDAELYWPENAGQVMQELERLACELEERARQMEDA